MLVTVIERVDANSLTTTSFAHKWLNCTPEQRQPVVLTNMRLGEVDRWTQESFRREFGDASMWDQGKSEHCAIDTFCGYERTPDAWESYIFEFLGTEGWEPPTPHSEKIRSSYSVPRLFGPDLWQLGAWPSSQSADLKIGRLCRHFRF